jgi:hypothetical protein
LSTTLLSPVKSDDATAVIVSATATKRPMVDEAHRYTDDYRLHIVESEQLLVAETVNV